MRESIGSIKSAVEMLTEQMKTQSDKLDKISHRVYGGVLVVVVVLGGIAWIITDLGGIRAVLELLSQTQP